MRYLISTLLLMLVIFLTAIVVYCVYLGLAYNWTWFFVGFGVLLSDLMAIAALSAAIPASREY